MNLKNEVLQELKKFDLTYNLSDFENLFVLSVDAKNGDVCLPCFMLAKQFKTAPNIIAQNLCDEIAKQVSKNGIKEKVEAVNGYLNIFANKEMVAKKIENEVLSEKQNLESLIYTKAKPLF